MDREQDKKSAIETDDLANRTVYGAPTIGGAIVFGGIILYILYDVFLK
ncbi:hypothetical protein P6P90_12745 [Ectobacillus antri]|jgi:hypothetical protein|uniref:Class IIb bacteriocin, lactobin A/cerein 7B family n=1 Tax=Ectobacillus antri TaxID=2486280 RepID=A0ABT6H651_9BACI|nr:MULTISPECIES: hypothetical protein [Ectobacillus]MDG4657780.1 hypothetical protein [Ectobacillus antri]MDG5754829.1 hypothetical protein [Ectobacillus antri]UOY92290.1 hypothetical protein MUG87_17945 [Ectobacillus sp. JY-23]